MTGKKLADAIDPPRRTAASEFNRELPKAELHIHIEGSLEPELMFELAARNRVALPFESVEAVRRAYAFDDLQSFLDIYYAGADVLRTERDFHDLADAYLTRAREDGVRHAEIFFDPQTHTDRGIALETVVAGLRDAIDGQTRTHGISAMLIPCFLRHLSAEAAMHTLDGLLALDVDFVAVGLDSSETGHPPRKFAAVFDRARAAGLRTVAHAGEEGPPGYVVEALDLLGVARIDHGVRSLESPELARRLARDQVPLTVCPLSNVALRVFDSIEVHNLPALLDAGLLVTIHSDDPAYFGGYIAANYDAVQNGLDLSREQLVGLARNSFDASFLPEQEKRRWQRAIDRFVGTASTRTEGNENG